MEENDIRQKAKELIKQGEEIRGWMSFYYLDPPKFRWGQLRAWAKHRWWREFHDPIWRGWYRQCFFSIAFIVVAWTLLIVFGPS